MGSFPDLAGPRFSSRACARTRRASGARSVGPASKRSLCTLRRAFALRPRTRLVYRRGHDGDCVAGVGVLAQHCTGCGRRPEQPDSGRIQLVVATPLIEEVFMGRPRVSVASTPGSFSPETTVIRMRPLPPGTSDRTLPSLRFASSSRFSILRACRAISRVCHLRSLFVGCSTVSA